MNKTAKEMSTIAVTNSEFTKELDAVIFEMIYSKYFLGNDSSSFLLHVLGSR